ncbi:MAG: hypothetical protein J5764_01270 [Bacteroidales bacterium]|nr:hypothetical protein [Bacteroidales bacterium]
MIKKSFIILAMAATLACGKIAGDPELPGTAPDNSSVTTEKWWALGTLPVSMKPANGHGNSVKADFSPSKTYLEMNGEETFASVIWTAGDEFNMFGCNESGQWYRAPYTTDNGGPDAEFYSNYGVPSPCYSIYPGITKLGSYDGNVLFGVNIPTTQWAVAGDIVDGLNISYAYSEEQTTDLHFQNMLALLRFRLSGELVSSVGKITLKCPSDIAGDTIIAVDEEGNAEITWDVRFEGDVASRSITLEGNFVAGDDYYIALSPGVQDGLTMIFSDWQGASLKKVSFNEFNFTRSRITDFGTIDLGDEFDETQPTYEPVLYNAATVEHPVSIVVIPDGFTAEQMDDYTIDAQIGLNALFNTEPYKTYRHYFNAWILKVASGGSGANVTDGNGNIITATDCFFGSKWGESSYGDMGADDDAIFNFIINTCPDILDGTHDLREVPIVMIINDPRYGGICWNWSSGEGYAMVPTTTGNLCWGYASKCAASDSDPSAGIRDVTEEERSELGVSDGDWRNVLIHEFGGHCFGKLADEYWGDSDHGAVTSIGGHNWGVPMSLNISATYNNPPWQAELLDRLDGLTATDAHYGRIGVFQGGDGSILNRWRSEKISCMIDNRSYFSAWQRMLIVKRIKLLAGETFDLDEFFALDKTDDPVRDAVSSPSPVRRSPIAPHPVPMLPPMRVVMSD